MLFLLSPSQCSCANGEGYKKRGGGGAKGFEMTVKVQLKTPLKIEVLSITKLTFWFLKLTDLLFVSLLLYPYALVIVSL